LKTKYIKSDKTWVKTHNKGKLTLDNFYGMPVILPTNVKHRLVKVKKGLSSGSLSRTDQLFIKLLFSILSFFRATSPDYSPTKLSTITGKFTGSCVMLPGLEIRMALRSMGISGLIRTPNSLPVKYGSKNSKRILFKSKPSLFNNSFKAGPNSTIAVLGIGLDLVA
jgi:hypothetical protein